MGRPKKEIDEKKKNISISINNDVFEKINKYLKENNINRSSFIEKLWIEHINKNKDNLNGN